MPLKRWKSPKQVKGIAVHRSHFAEPSPHAAWPKSGNVGHVLVGKVRFKRGNSGKSARHWAAIKMFKHPIPDSYARRYERAITRLRKAGVNIPKMGMLKFARAEGLEPEWHQVMQLFGSLREGKLSTSINGASHEQKLLAAKEAAKILNAGFAPPLDALTFFADPRKGVVVVDIDSLVRTDAEQGIGRLVRYTPKEKAGNLLWVLFNLAKSRSEFRQLFAEAQSALLPKWSSFAREYFEHFVRRNPDRWRD